MIFNIEDQKWLITAFSNDADIAAPPGISVVQHRSSFASGTSVALAFASNVTAGNTLIYCSAGSGTTAMVAATDNNSNTIVNADTGGGTGVPHSGAIRVDYVASANGGATTVTATQSDGGRVMIFIWEISGLTSKTLDQQNTATQAATSQSISTSSSTTAANELVVGFFYDQITNDSITAGSGFSPSEFVSAGAGNETGLAEVKIVSSTGIQTATATCGSATNSLFQSITTFK